MKKGNVLIGVIFIVFMGCASSGSNYISSDLYSKFVGTWTSEKELNGSYVLLEFTPNNRNCRFIFYGNNNKVEDASTFSVHNLYSYFIEFIYYDSWNSVKWNYVFTDNDTTLTIIYSDDSTVTYTFYKNNRGNGNSSIIETALSNASNELQVSLNKNSRIAIVNISSPDTDMSSFIASELEYLLVKNQFIVVDRSELDRIRLEQNFQLSGEVDDNTIVSIGKFVGADIVITGSITGIGSTRRLRLRALSTQTAQVMGVASEPF
jgi:hypothetical protein